MTISILAPSYGSAADALIGVNHDAAMLYGDLATSLEGCGEMAGDDSTSTEFATAYDTEAQAAVDAIRDLIDAAGNLGVLAASSIENHRTAEAAAAYTAPPLLYDGCRIPRDAGEVDVGACDLPTSLGGDAGGLPPFLDIVIDHVQGVVWPNADLERLRDAAKAWRTAAGALDGLELGCRSALDHLTEQRAPEIPLALAAVGDLERAAAALADACAALGGACADYADEVEERRQEITNILRDLAVEAGVTGVVGGVLSVFTAGLTGAAATAAITARAAVFGGRIIKVLEKLKTAVRLGALVRLGSAGTKVKRVGPVLKRLARRTARQSKRVGRDGRRMDRDELTPAQAGKLKRYRKKLPAGAESTVITEGKGGTVVLSSRVPGRVPGSYAVYEKTVDAAGDTVAYTKTTVLPDGHVAHVKDKLHR
ncbi:hypothetical protein KG112_14225 [Nocardioides sp. zg-ZUI104]|uniref:WXG100-like domain-containing protein n=1 Tax=Nocardioides faecalis TaxID=2803858 RepID=UPI001BD1980E|nr:hypothetical protein [Nocardioides faecalis]MBS4753966.1 hypothetical protein [Nocardioides faecalis]